MYSLNEIDTGYKSNLHNQFILDNTLMIHPVTSSVGIYIYIQYIPQSLIYISKTPNKASIQTRQT